ncbi:MAG: hypothetical protein HY785_15320 [Oscillatoriophycideae cyanobacterium NC_groundwater_1537_Pr4_S-0.65um_50_18]|nr:hypothetical protein [Oscillatoriophycideae cyanobacterium NC_groundwater_1537_Pr4_S-0.65um_50_18]
MSFANHLVSSALLVGALFSVTTFPLAAFSAKPVTVELERDTVFAGSVKDIAVPYLLTTAAISIGAGVANLAVLSWQQSSRKLVSMEGKVSKLTHQLSETESQLEYLKFSQTKLDALGLAGFLQAESRPSAQLGAAGAVAQTRLLSQSSTVASTVRANEFRANEFRANETPATAQAVVISQPVFTLDSAPALPPYAPNVRAAASFPAAQAFMGFARPKSPEPILSGASIDSSLPDSNAASLNLNNPVQVSELLTNLKQVMAQLEKLHTVQTEQTENPASYSKFAS